MADINKITLPNGDAYTFEDENGRQKTADLITVSDSAPSSPDNKLWIKTSGSRGVLVPTVEEALALGIEGASVGQIPKIASVGNSGEPTAWTVTNYNPDTKTSDMVKPVGVDANGKLWTEISDPATIASATEDWLDENVAQETGYVIDNSLTISGAAADAKKVGDEVGELKSAVSEFGSEKVHAVGTADVVFGNLFDAALATEGWYLRGISGTPEEDPNYGYSDYIPLNGDQYLYSENIKVQAIYFYDESKVVLSPAARAVQNFALASSWPSGAKYCRFNFYVSAIDSIDFRTSVKTGYYISKEQIVDFDFDFEKYYLPINGNQFDSSKGTEGYYLGGPNGDERQNPDYGYSDYIRTYGTTLTIEGVNGNAVYFYDVNKVVLGYAAARDITVFPPGTAYIRFNYPLASKSNMYVFLNADDAIYKLPNGVKKIPSTDIIDAEARYTILCGSTRTITTIKDAITEAERRLTLGISHINIILDAGTYDVFPSAELAGYSSTYEGLRLPNNCNLYGSGKDQTFIVGRLPANTGGYDFDPQRMSVLNIYYSNELKDVTLIAKNCRYALHNDDFKGRAIKKAVEVFENVTFIFEENDTGVVTSKIAVGIGAYNGRTTKFTNCIFKNENVNVEAALLHNNVDSPLPCEWTFDTCDFVGNNFTTAIALSSAGSGQHDEVIFKGCDFNGGSLRFYPQSVYTGTQNEIYVRGFGNTTATYIWSGITEDMSTIHLIP